MAKVSLWFKLKLRNQEKMSHYPGGSQALRDNLSSPPSEKNGIQMSLKLHLTILGLLSFPSL